MVFILLEIHTFLSVLAGLVVIALLFGSDGRYDYGEWPLWKIVFLSMLAYQVVFLTACFLLLPRRHGKKLVKALDTLPEFKTHRLKTRDGLELTWFKSEVPSGSEAPLMLVCLPNGQDGPAMFNPLFSLFGHRFQYVCWSCMCRPMPQPGHSLSLIRSLGRSTSYAARFYNRSGHIWERYPHPGGTHVHSGPRGGCLRSFEG